MVSILTLLLTNFMPKKLWGEPRNEPMLDKYLFTFHNYFWYSFNIILHLSGIVKKVSQNKLTFSIKIVR